VTVGVYITETVSEGSRQGRMYNVLQLMCQSAASAFLHGH